jgi:hypothetical protein
VVIRALLAVLPLLVAAPRMAAAAAQGVSPESARGAYRMVGTARVTASPLPGQSTELRADAVLRPGAGPRQIRARLAAQGHACELSGRLDPDGAIAFDAGQRCQVDLDGPEARGRVEARLQSGRGQLTGRDLSLDLTWEIAGTVSLSTGGVRMPGLDLEVPATWTPATPVRGEARATATGTRDDSRASGR